MVHALADHLAGATVHQATVRAAVLPGNSAASFQISADEPFKIGLRNKLVPSCIRVHLCPSVVKILLPSGTSRKSPVQLHVLPVNLEN